MIPFPTMHIAESVLNRIQNTLEDMDEKSTIDKTTALAAPLSPDPTLEGMKLDAQLDTAPIPAAVPAGRENLANSAMLESSALGGSPLDGALAGAFGSV